MTVKQYLDDWLTLRSSGLAPRTVECYRHLIDEYLSRLTGSIEDLQPMAIQSLIASICADGHQRTAQLCLIVLKSALSDALAVGQIAVNPAARVQRPRHFTAEPRYWSPDEIRRFALYCDKTRWGCAWLLAMFCGLRRGELAGLRWSDIDLQGAVIHVRNQRQRIGSSVVDCAPKSAAGRRDIPLPSHLVSVLQSELRRQRSQAGAGGIFPAYVVSCIDNSPIDPHRLNKALSHDIAVSGLRPINLHGLRHSMATAAVAAGVSIKVLQELLGHANYSTTADVYAHVLQTEKIKAIDTLEYAVYNANGT